MGKKESDLDVRKAMMDTKSSPAPGGRLISVKTQGTSIPMFISDEAYRLDRINFEAFIGINHVLIRWANRRFPNEHPMVRAHAAAISSWVNPGQAAKYLENKVFGMSFQTRELTIAQIRVLREIVNVFGENLTYRSLMENKDIKDIVYEVWATNPPTVLPSSIGDKFYKQKSELVNRVLDYTFYLHEKFHSVHPMVRAEVASLCAERTALHMLKNIKPDAIPMVIALANRFERN